MRQLWKERRAECDALAEGGLMSESLKDVTNIISMMLAQDSSGMNFLSLFRGRTLQEWRKIQDELVAEQLPERADDSD